MIYTDIGRDGMMSGVNIEATVKLANLPIILYLCRKILFV
ncbi:MAG: hypothetical protein ACFN01_03200 [Capnocytophaga leadbetteri]